MDKLDIGYINNLPQPLTCRMIGDQDHKWPVQDICVETGLVRIDVCGLLQVVKVAEIISFKDMDDNVHDSDDFYSDARLGGREE